MLEVRCSVWDKETLKQRFSGGTLQTNGDEIYFPECPLNLRLQRPNTNIFLLIKIFKFRQPLCCHGLVLFRWIMVLFLTKPRKENPSSYADVSGAI